MGIFDRAKDTATTRQDGSNEPVVIDSGSQPPDPDASESAAGTDSTTTSTDSTTSTDRTTRTDADG
ncbi:MAG TPA: hypothetical protein VF642_09305 [Propionibacteriaceae bacterium]